MSLDCPEMGSEDFLEKFSKIWQELHIVTSLRRGSTAHVGIPRAGRQAPSRRHLTMSSHHNHHTTHDTCASGILRQTLKTFPIAIPPTPQAAPSIWHEGQRESQELNNRMCSHNLGLETTTQTFMFHVRPNPICDWTSVKRSRRV